MTNLLKKIYPFLFGVMAALPIAFPSLGMLQWAVLLPFAFMALEDSGGKNSIKAFRGDYLRALCFFFGYYVISYSWFFEMYPLSVTDMPRAAAFFVVCLAALGIPLFQSIGLALIFPAFKYVSRRGLPTPLKPILMGSLWAFAEWVQGLFWFGIPFVRMAMGQINTPALFRSSNLFGSYFVTFLLVVVNFYLTLALKSAENKKRTAFAFAAAGIFILNGFYGILDIAVSTEKESETVKIAALQGNVSTEEKWNSEMLGKTFSIYASLAEEAAEQGAEYALFPETVIPYVSEDFPEIEAYLQAISDKNDITLMVGTFTSEDTGVGNGIRVYIPGEESRNVYTKRRPVPFGEYVPMRDFIMTVLPVLGEINMLDRSLVPGVDSSIFENEDGAFGHLICFDSIYDYTARESVLGGAKVLLISTNDSWFGSSIGTKMHCAQAVLRAVENGRSTVRAANTGISAIINTEGEVTELIECDREGLIIADVELEDHLTLYSRIGNLFVLLCALFTIFSFFYKNIGTKLPFFRL